MKAAALAGAVFSLAAAGKLDESAPAITEDLLAAIRRSGATWTAGHHQGRNATIGDVKAQCGTYLPGDERYKENPRLAKRGGERPAVGALPTDFDARVVRPIPCPP